MKLYRFRPIDQNTLTSLESNEWWHAHYRCLNDPFEGYHRTDCPHNTVEQFINLLYVCCFSKSNDSTLMWSFYADQFRGICIEFEFNDTKEYDSTFVPVQYTTEPPYVPGIELVYSEKEKRDLAKISIDLHGPAFTTKHTAWYFEDEVRRWVMDKDTTKRGKLAKVGGKITKIFFGHKCTDSQILSVVEVLKKQPDIKFYLVDKESFSYGVRFKRLDLSKVSPKSPETYSCSLENIYSTLYFDQKRIVTALQGISG